MFAPHARQARCPASLCLLQRGRHRTCGESHRLLVLAFAEPERQRGAWLSADAAADALGL